MEIKSKEIVLVDIDTIVENPKNMNVHSKEQIERLAKLIKHSGFRDPLIVSKRSGFVIAGHGRTSAAKLIGMKEIPVIYQDFKDEAEEYQFMVSHNAIASWAELDLSMVHSELENLGEFDFDLLGIKDFELPDIDNGTKGEDSVYTSKIETPVYTPTGARPEVEELFDSKKTEQLLKEINQTKIPEEIKAFLRFASSRHTVFNFEKIAEFYAHASADVQELMEKSALVIIDYDKAIDNGFVNMVEALAQETNSNE